MLFRSDVGRPGYLAGRLPLLAKEDLVDDHDDVDRYQRNCTTSSAPSCPRPTNALTPHQRPNSPDQRNSSLLHPRSLLPLLSSVVLKPIPVPSSCTRAARRMSRRMQAQRDEEAVVGEDGDRVD